ncbi:MAG: hypothetical protein ACJAZ3_000731 [Sphingobacteriales bacterium]|jgi:hypothetical protein
MENKSFLVGSYDDEQTLKTAVKKLRAEGINLYDVFTPFPVHGLEHALGMKDSRLPIVAFLFGCLGLTAALSMQIFMLGIDWPMDIGGKPALAYPDFVPVSFELTVLFAALGMVGTFLFKSELIPVADTKILHESATDDRFLIAIDKERGQNLSTIKELFKSTGAVDIFEKDVV